MKKVLFLIVTLVCAVTGAWAGNPTVSYDSGTGTLTITSDEAGKLTTSMVSAYTGATKLVLSGKFNEDDLKAVGHDKGFTAVKTIDYSKATFPKSLTYKLYNEESDRPNEEWTPNVITLTGADYYTAVTAPEGKYTWEKAASYYNATTTNNYAVSEEEMPEATENSTLAVGGSAWTYDWQGWKPASIEGMTTDWNIIRFSYWNGLEEIVLPANITADKLNQNSFYGDNNKRTLTKITSGDTYAVITHNGDNRKASVFAGTDAEFVRMKSILGLNNFININDPNNVVRESLSGDYIRYDANTKIAEVRVTEAGSFSKLFKGESNYETGTVFRFID